MPAEIFALANAFLFALHNMLTKKGLRYSNPVTAVITSLVINIIVLWGVSLLYVPLDSLTRASILIFVLVGLFQPGFTRFLTYKGIEHLGIAITDPIRASTPLFSALFAILLLGERMTLPIFFATLLIILGITLLSQREGSVKEIRSLYPVPQNAPHASAGMNVLNFPEGQRPKATDVSPWYGVYIFYPLFASFLAGFSQVLRKFGLASVPHPFLAAAVTASSSFVVSLLTVWVSGKRKEMLRLNKDCLVYYVPAGVIISLGMVAIYYALDRGQVTVVIPIGSTGPFFALILSALFLRDLERVTFKIVIGACLIISGVLLITLWK